MKLATERYFAQEARWPTQGRHILAQHDARAIVVYQAFRPDIADAAVRAGRLAEGFSLSRMSWIKPNFLWMMFRCGWATKESQERVLAIHLTREGFDEILAGAVHSSPVPEVYGDRTAWQAALKASTVRLQWDPDHTPHGAKCERRAVQLGLSGATLARYVSDFTLGVEDITDFVREQHEHVVQHRLDLLETPSETVVSVADPAVAARLCLSPH